jgi:hypothetical protein
MFRVPINDRRSDREKRVAVRQAIDLHRHGNLTEALRLLLERGVPKPVIVRTLLNDDHKGS